MTERGSEAVNPARGIYDALSDEAKAAVDALPDDVLSLDSGDHAASEFAKAISDASRLAPGAWSLMCDRESNGKRWIAVALGATNLLSVDAKRFKVVIDTTAPELAELQTVLAELDTGERYRTSPALKQITVPGEEDAFGEYRGLLLNVNSSLVSDYASRGWSKSQRANWHRDDWRVKLALITGTELPAPDYVTPDRLGLPGVVKPYRRQGTFEEFDDGGSLTDSSTSNAEDDAAILDVTATLVERFTALGMRYEETQVASYYTALQTKGFVILSGISGTGKSKIAQRFARMLPIFRTRSQEGDPSAFVPFSPYMKASGRFYVPKKLADLLPPMRKGEDVFPQVNIDAFIGTCRLNLTTHENPDTYVYLKDDAASAFTEIQGEGFYLAFQLNDLQDAVEHVVISSEPIEAGERLVVRESSSTLESSGQLFLPVRPEWRDGKALIGYHNPLKDSYVATDFLDFVIAAGDDYRAGNRNAFFVILDEMNLAHVEYYFADVLSVIESGRDEEGWTVEGIPLAVGEEDADLPDVLKLPPNLYIVGTVNMDETTHPFSPKVLDRAFTIELTDVDFSNYPPDHVEGDAHLNDEERQALLRAFTRNGRYPRIDKEEIRAVVENHPGFRDDLSTLNRGLERYRMHFGYRVFDEIMQFVHHAEANGMFGSVEAAFDHAVLMKVLPKFNGSRAKLESALFELLHWARVDGAISVDARDQLATRLDRLSDERRPFDTIVVSGTGSVEDDWRYPATGRRAALMMQDLYTDGFASFG